MRGSRSSTREIQDLMENAQSFNLNLRDVLVELNEHQYSLLHNPPELKKRASVALIIRVNPGYDFWPEKNVDEKLDEAGAASSTGRRLERFFDQEWVREGSAEVLFIKRANRKGDRWTGHIALPGGGREPADEDDAATAIRETAEEVGLNLADQSVLHIGNLPQRLVTTSWGKIPLMVLCPYIFLLTRHNIPPLRLQPSEIASTHWVPLRSLLSPDARTFEHQDVSSRLARQEFGFRRVAYKTMLGNMLFSAVRLFPVESLHSVPPKPVHPKEPGYRVIMRSLIWLGFKKTTQPSPDLLLWGLTLGVLADFLELLPPHNALQLWSYPTFSAPDVQFLVWFFSYRFRRGRYAYIKDKPAYAPAEIELGLDSIPKPLEDHYHQKNPPDSGESGIGVVREHEGQSRRRVRRGSRSSRIGFMLDGYYEIIRKAIAAAMVGRGIVATLIAILIWKRLRTAQGPPRSRS